jgi:hypothetical protein
MVIFINYCNRGYGNGGYNNYQSPLLSRKQAKLFKQVAVSGVARPIVLYK